jgi:hypothetical protein
LPAGWRTLTTVRFKSCYRCFYKASFCPKHQSGVKEDANIRCFLNYTNKFLK